MQKKIEKILFGFEIIAFQLILWKIRFYWENIIVIGCQFLTKSLKISDTSQSYQKL